MEYTYIHNHQSQFLEWFGNPFLSPKNGESVSITDVADIVLGTTPNSKIKEYWDGELKWITPAEIEEESFIISDTVRHITEDGRNSANLTLLPVGSVLFSTRAPIGKVAIAGEEMYYLVQRQSAFNRKVVMEEGTGTWCGYCPEGMATILRMKEKYPDNFIAVAIHDDDDRS